MKNNQPVTQREKAFDDSRVLVSTTDTKGIITYCNQPFIEISGFAEAELLKASHNIIRHPDMPPAAFKDLWSTIKAGKPWRGIVKNRCKNGDHYWVDAYVTPVYDGDKLLGYQSVRIKPTREQIKKAERLYARVRARDLADLPKPLFPEFGHRVRLTAAFALVGLGAVAAGGMGNLWLGVATLALILAQVTGRSIFTPLETGVAAAKKIAAGDLTFPIHVAGNNETAEILQAIKMLQSRLATVIGNLQESAMGVAEAAHRLALAATVTEVARNSSDAADAAHQAHADAQSGNTVVHTSVGGIERLASGVTEIATAIGRLGTDAENIGKILDVIRGIAGQTSLLALNAAIEAARAGDQGRGFAVVADEVRALATRTEEATREIQTMIQRLQDGTRKAVGMMQDGHAQAQQSVLLAVKTGQALDSITQSVERINDMNIQIATATEEQSAVVAEMSRNVERIRTLSVQTLDSTDGVVSATGHLEQLAERLTRLVHQYKI